MIARRLDDTVLSTDNIITLPDPGQHVFMQQAGVNYEMSMVSDVVAVDYLDYVTSKVTSETV